MADKTTTPPGTAKGKPNGMTKMEAVRRALSDLGKDAMPTQLQGHIREKYGIEMSIDHISVCKGKILRKGKKAKGRKPAAPKEAAAAPPAKPVAVRNGISLPDLRAIKELVARFGRSQLHDLIDLLAR
jgi:hypothetical protein